MIQVYLEPSVADTFGQCIYGVTVQSQGQFRQVNTLKEAGIAIVSTQSTKEEALHMGKRVIWIATGEPRKSDARLPRSPQAERPLAVEQNVRWLQYQGRRFSLDLRDMLKEIAASLEPPANSSYNSGTSRRETCPEVG